MESVTFSPTEAENCSCSETAKAFMFHGNIVEQKLEKKKKKSHYLSVMGN
jgi:hypothetical protein